MWRVVLAMAVAALWLVPAYAATAKTSEYATSGAKHSGEVVAVTADTLTLDEMGPWRATHQTVTKRTFDVAPSAKIEMVARTKQAGEDGWLGGFIESPLKTSDLKTGDYVTVTVSKAGKKLVAESIQVVRPASD